MKEHKNTKKRRYNVKGNLGENESVENIHFLGNDEQLAGVIPYSRIINLGSL
jgi:hypothetical protein